MDEEMKCNCGDGGHKCAACGTELTEADKDTAKCVEGKCYCAGCAPTKEEDAA
jgi:hypothetical protein